jgi:hypothetical protein
MSVLVGSAIPRFTDGWQSFRVTHADAIEVKQRLLSAGVRVPPNGRLNEYIRQLALSGDVRVPTIPWGFDWQRLHHAVADIAEWRFVLDYLANGVETAGWKAKAHLAMKGSARPAEEGKNSGAWDNQFELFMAALCRRAGFGVELAEPDLLVRYNDACVGIAAKRPRSLGNFDKLLARADKQIARSGRSGIIALDISYVSNPGEMYFVAGGGDQPYIRRLVDSFLNDNHARMLNQVNPSHTIGIIIYACALALDYAEVRLAVARGSVFGNFCSLDDPRLVLLNTLRSAITVAI